MRGFVLNVLDLSFPPNNAGDGSTHAEPGDDFPPLLRCRRRVNGGALVGCDAVATFGLHFNAVKRNMRCKACKKPVGRDLPDGGGGKPNEAPLCFRCGRNECFRCLNALFQVFFGAILMQVSGGGCLRRSSGLRGTL